MRLGCSVSWKRINDDQRNETSKDWSGSEAPELFLYRVRHEQISDKLRPKVNVIANAV